MLSAEETTEEEIATKRMALEAADAQQAEEELRRERDQSAKREAAGPKREAAAATTEAEKQMQQEAPALAAQRNVEHADKKVKLGITLDLPSSSKVSESKAAAAAKAVGDIKDSRAQTVVDTQQHQKLKETQEEGEAEQPLAFWQRDPAAIATNQTMNSRIVNWSYGVSLDLSMTPASVPQTPMSPSIYAFPQLPCSPRAPTPTQHLTPQPLNACRFSPPALVSGETNDRTQSPVPAGRGGFKTLSFPQLGITPDEKAPKAASEREEERERDREKEKNLNRGPSTHDRHSEQMPLVELVLLSPAKGGAQPSTPHTPPHARTPPHSQINHSNINLSNIVIESAAKAVNAAMEAVSPRVTPRGGREEEGRREGEGGGEREVGEEARDMVDVLREAATTGRHSKHSALL